MGEDVPFQIRETVWITLPDGTRLAARLWLPEGADVTPVPAILEYIPYRRRDFTRARDDRTHPRFAAAGYAVIRVDMRGSGDSDGLMHDEYLEQEQRDGFDVVQWIADQPWCDGAVGMMGKSWGAYTAFQVAALRPPALRAIIPVMGTDDRWSEDIHFRNGVLATDNFWWGSIMQLFNAAPPDPEIVGTRWRDMWRERLDGMTLWTAEWMRHQTRDEFWINGSISRDYADVQVPVYYFTGWADVFCDTPFRLAEHLQSPCKVVAGPWAHLYPHDGIPGPQIDFVAEALKWWDRWLRGLDNGIMDEPRLRFYVQDPVAPVSTLDHRPGRWVEERDWPSTGIHPQVFWLNADGLGEAPQPDGAPLTVCSPQTHGAAGGDMASFAIPGDLPVDCRIDEGGALTFRSAPLGSAIDIVGQVAVNLSVAADRGQAFVACILAAQAPDGTQTLVSRGFFNLMHRNGPDTPVPVVPGEEMAVTVYLQGTACCVPRDHRLVLHVASTYWPILWPAPEPVTLHLAPGRSSLELPVRVSKPDKPTPRPLPEPPAPLPSNVTEIEAGSLERSIETDLVTGDVIHRVYIDGGVFGPIGRIRFDATGMEMRDTSERLYSIRPDDPLSARAVMTQTRVMERGSWSIRTDARSEMWATKQSFHINASVESWEGEDPFHRVEWSFEIPRNGM